jgi:quinol monooxygenase YgiN
MAGAANDPRKFIIGWLTCKPGRRDEVMALVVPYVSKCLMEEGCEFFEMNPSVQNPDVITLAECFASSEAHALHLQTVAFQAFWKGLQSRCVEGRFLNIFADRVEPDSATFGA